MKVIELSKTCAKSLTQWEGKLEDGRMVYIRYWKGYLEVRVSKGPTDKIDFAVLGDEVFGKQLYLDNADTLELEKLKEATKGVLDFSDLLDLGEKEE